MQQHPQEHDCAWMLRVRGLPELMPPENKEIQEHLAISMFEDVFQSCTVSGVARPLVVQYHMQLDPFLVPGATRYQMLMTMTSRPEAERACYMLRTAAMQKNWSWLEFRFLQVGMRRKQHSAADVASAAAAAPAQAAAAEAEPQQAAEAQQGQPAAAGPLSQPAAGAGGGLPAQMPQGQISEVDMDVSMEEGNGASQEPGGATASPPPPPPPPPFLQRMGTPPAVTTAAGEVPGLPEASPPPLPPSEATPPPLPASESTPPPLPPPETRRADLTPGPTTSAHVGHGGAADGQASDPRVAPRSSERLSAGQAPPREGVLPASAGFASLGQQSQEPHSVREEPRGVKRPRDEEAPLEGLRSLSILEPTAGTKPGHLRPRSSLADPSSVGPSSQQSSRPGSSRVGSAGRRSRSPSGARSQRPATAPPGRPGSKQDEAERRGKSRGDSREGDRGRRSRRESGSQQGSGQQNGRRHRFNSPDRHRGATLNRRSMSPRSRGQSRERSRRRRPASPDRKRHRRSPERSWHKSNKSREREGDRSRPDSSKRGGQRHDRHDGASRPGASWPDGGPRGDKQERENGSKGMHSKGSALHSATQGSTDPRSRQGQPNGKASASQSVKEGSMAPLEGAGHVNNLQNNCLQHSQGGASLSSSIHSWGSQRDGGGQPGARLDAHHGAAEGSSGKQTKQAWPEMAGVSRHDGVGQPGAPSSTYHKTEEGPDAKRMQQAWPEMAEGSGRDGPGHPGAPSQAQHGAAEGLSGKHLNQAWPEVAGARAAPVVGQAAASLGFKQMSGISDEQHEGQPQPEAPWSPTAHGPDWAANLPEEPAGLLEGGQPSIRDHSTSHLQPALGEELWSGSLSKHEGDPWRAVVAHTVTRLRGPTVQECSLPQGYHLETNRSLSLKRHRNMLHGLGLHAEQLQVWALRATEGNLLEDSSKAIGEEVFSNTVWLPSGGSTERRGLAYHICLPSSTACHWLSIPKSAKPALSSCLLMMLIPCWTGRVRMPQQMPIKGLHGQSLPILVHGPGTHLLPLAELAAQWTALRQPGQVAGLPAADPSAWRLVKAPDTGPDGHPPPDREEVKKWHQDAAAQLQVQGVVWCVPLGNNLGLVIGPKSSSTPGLHWLIQHSDLC